MQPKHIKSLPKLDKKRDIGWSLQPVKPLLGFALTIAFTSSIWVLLTQLDKLVLSGILALSEYGYFTLAVLVAGGVLQIGSPLVLLLCLEWLVRMVSKTMWS